MRGSVTFLVFISTMVFPWPLTVLLVLAASSIEPLIPFAAGLFADTLYYVPHDAALPLWSIGGGVVSLIASVVHSRLRTGSIRR